MMFERKQLIALRDKAGELGTNMGLSGPWRRAYLGLADAADRLDAMLARSTAGEQAEKK